MKPAELAALRAVLDTRNSGSKNQPSNQWVFSRFRAWPPLFLSLVSQLPHPKHLTKLAKGRMALPAKKTMFHGFYRHRFDLSCSYLRQSVRCPAPHPRAGLRGGLSSLYTGIMEWRVDEPRARDAPVLRRAMPVRNAQLVTTG
jgi:hypothetical protein